MSFLVIFVLSIPSHKFHMYEDILIMHNLTMSFLYKCPGPGQDPRLLQTYSDPSLVLSVWKTLKPFEIERSTKSVGISSRLSRPCWDRAQKSPDTERKEGDIWTPEVIRHPEEDHLASST